jgi:hypothetical protein
MKVVWRALSKLEPAQRVEFFDRVRMHDAVRNQLAALKIPGDAVQRRAFKKIAGLTQKIIDAFTRISPDARPGDLSLLYAALRRIEGYAVLHTDSRLLNDAVRLKRATEAIRRHQAIDLVGALTTLQEATLLAAVSTDTPLPKKRNSKGATANWLANDVAILLRPHFTRPRYALIAHTVNAALGLYEEPLTAEAVRGLLRKPVEKKQKSK